MGFNLATFGAQLINLFLLIWILKHFLYQPVLAIIDKRRKEIEAQFHEADEKLASATTLEKDLAEQKKLFDNQRQVRLDALDNEISQQKKQMINELEQNYQTKRQQLQDTLNNAWITAENSIHNMLASEFIQLSQKVLTEWSNQTPMDQVLSLFKKKVNTLSQNQKASLQKILLKQKTILVNSSEPLTQKQKDFVKGVLLKDFVLPSKVKFQFKKQSTLILGLEIRLGNFLLDWSLNSYLEEVNQRLKQNIAVLITPTQRKAKK